MKVPDHDVDKAGLRAHAEYGFVSVSRVTSIRMEYYRGPVSLSLSLSLSLCQTDRLPLSLHPDSSARADARSQVGTATIAVGWLRHVVITSWAVAHPSVGEMLRAGG